MKNYKTTLCGIVTILGVLVDAALDYLNHGVVNVPVIVSGITIGIGLIKAADAKTQQISRWP